MTLLIISFLAGVLTVAAPCIITLLPVIIGGTLARSDDKPSGNEWQRPLIVATSLVLSIVIFTLLLKATTSLLGVPDMFWRVVSGIIVTLLGVDFLFPRFWETIAIRTGLHVGSNKLLGKNLHRKGLTGDVMTGLALGPVFSSCSPTYAFIVAAILPASFAVGLSYLFAYAIGLASALLLIAFLGQSLIRRLGWLSNPSGWFRRAIGIMFILLGLSVAFGFERSLQTKLLESGVYDPISRIEESLRR